jgi:hypothetical protein
MPIRLIIMCMLVVVVGSPLPGCRQENDLEPDGRVTAPLSSPH